MISSVPASVNCDPTLAVKVLAVPVGTVKNAAACESATEAKEVIAALALAIKTFTLLLILYSTIFIADLCC